MKKIVDLIAGISKRTRGLILCLVICGVFFGAFFPKIIQHPNRYLFDRSGDGLLSYYYAMYQIKYDSTYWRVGASNYPYGESTFFSSSQPLLSAGLKMVDPVIPVADHVPGILNYLMLFSFVFCVIFIYLLLYEFKVSYIVAAIFAAGITFLSPQWLRLEGHFSLSCAFAIPGLFYFLFRYDQQPTRKRSFILAMYVFLVACIQIYYIAFFGLIFFVYYLADTLRKIRQWKAVLKNVLNAFIQLGVPFLLLQAMIYMSSDVRDRTQYPWGILIYISNLKGLFYPYAQPYSDAVGKFWEAEPKPEFEGISYVGLMAIILAVVLIIRQMWYGLKAYRPAPEQKMMIIFLICGILGAIYACGIPYIYKPQLLQSAGFLRQMRGIGRFAWILFYALNIFTVCVLCRYVERIKYVLVRIAIYGIFSGLLFYDAYFNSARLDNRLANELPALADHENELPQDQWVKKIAAGQYQAIIPLPYFLQGSENVVTFPDDPAICREAYVASLKTGLPITAAILSRTSLKQAHNNLAMVQEPYRSLQIASDFPNKKPFLLLARENEITDPWQKNLLTHATLLCITPQFKLFELSYQDLVSRADSMQALVQREIKEKNYVSQNAWSSDCPANYVYRSFDENRGDITYRGAGAYFGNIHEYNLVFSDSIPGAGDESDYVLSFWIYDFTEDLYPRSYLDVYYLDKDGKAYGGSWNVLSRNYSVTDGPWALIEFPVKPAKRGDKVCVDVFNQEIANGKRLIIDELMIRPKGCNMYRDLSTEFGKNNRYYKK